MSSTKDKPLTEKKDHISSEKSSHIHFQQLYNHLPIILYSFGIKSRIINVSDIWLNFFGYNREEVINKNFATFLTEESRLRFEGSVYEKCMKDEEVQKVNLQILMKNEGLANIRFSAIKESREREEESRFFFVFHDASDLTKAQDALENNIIEHNVLLSAIQTPLKEALGKLTTIRDQVTPELREEMDKILENLSDENFLRPHFSSPKFSLDIDAEINKWLIKEYSTVASTYSFLHHRSPSPKKDYSSLQGLTSLSFNTCEYSDRQFELINLIIKMFKHFNLLETFNIEEKVLRFFLNAIKAEYRNVPFHNFLHACDVTQMIFHFLTEGGIGDILPPTDILALLISSIGHDVCHPGLNSNFLELSLSPLATTYNDISILENYHTSSLFNIINRYGCNIFQNIPQEEVRKIRKIVISNILATDMKHHFEILTLFSNRVAKSFDFKITNQDDRLLLMKITLKCADVCNAARPYHIAKIWSGKVMEEYFLQGDLERSAGLPISSFMDRETTSIPKSQAAFIEFIAKPLYGSFALISPQIQECIHNIEENSKIWHQKHLQERTDSEQK